MPNKTILYDYHVELNAKMVDFAGWMMPINYGSQIEEHHAVRNEAGMFDVSHMVVIDIKGKQSKDYLKYLLANNVDRLQPGKALYSCMLNESGGVIDDLIIYYIQDNWYRLVTNAGTHDKDLAWINKQAKAFNVDIKENKDAAIIAVQGPDAVQKVDEILTAYEFKKLVNLKPFQGMYVDDMWIARTGYTGEDGYEIILPNQSAVNFWQKLYDHNVIPCGLGARDTLRLEAGLNLYGADMDENVTPLESNLAWTIAWDPEDRGFIGREALERQKQAGIKQRFVGIILQGKGVLRSHQKVRVDDIGFGMVTSGTYSPTMSKSIGLARIPVGSQEQCFVEIRGKWLEAKIVKPPFVKNGKILV